MNMILWTIFYLIVSLILMYFFFKEKYVINLLRVKEDEILKKVSLEKNEKNIMIGNVLTIVALVVTAIFFILIDRTPDSIIRIKLWGIYGVFILNVVFYVLRAEHEWIFLGNLVMMFLGRLMFNILDMNFYIYLGINVVISLILIYLFKSLPKEEITEQTILKEVTKDNKKLEKILTESKIKNESTEEIFKKIFPNENISVEERIAKEERKRSTFGKAISRIDNTMLAIILVMVIQVFYIGNYVIPSGSMEPTIAIKDRVFANMVKYRFTHPKVGQIIKEPMTDKVMYTKRLVGEPGTTLQIAKGKMDINKFEIANVDNKPVYPSFSGDKRKFEEDFKKYTEQVNEFNANKLQNVGGAIMTNDKKSEILEKVTPQKVYLPEGLLMNNKIYIPKKGDKVKLDKIIAINKVFGKTDDGTLVGQVDWESYYDGKGYKNFTGKEFLELIKTDKNFKDIIGNDDELNANPANVLTNAYYTFTLKVEGRDEMVMPIMDFKYNDDLFKKLLNGETITLDKNYYMAMGDNTANSKDTRYFGLVSEPRIKGELLIRWWPLSRIGLL